MSIQRTPKHSNYTRIDNAIFTDSRLSLRAKGLLCTMLSNSDEWEFYVKQLATTCRDGEASIYSALKELAQYGYLDIERQRVEGKYSGMEYNVFESPHRTSPHVVKPHVEKPHVGKPHVENRALTILTDNKTNSNNNNSNKRKKNSVESETQNPPHSEEERLQHLLKSITNGH